jgi:hypothetical protein
MYKVRFGGELDRRLTLKQIRRKEGIRVPESYARASRETGCLGRDGAAGARNGMQPTR